VQRSYSCLAEDRRNVSVWDANAYLSSIDKDVTTDLMFTQGPQENGGIIINWHQVDPLSNPHQEYFHALLDRRENALRLMRYTGVSPISEVARVTLPIPPVVGHWYRMNVTTQLQSGSTVIIKSKVAGVTDLSWPTATLTVPTNQYYPDDGLFGLGSVRSVCNFSYFAIKERT
jgi:hypothetical protein